jgi:hypothetical protein
MVRKTNPAAITLLCEIASKGLHVASGGGVMRSPVRGRFAYTEIESGPGSK